jgi:hypothetical protein
MLPSNSSDPQIVFGNSGASPFKIGLDVTVVMRRQLVGRQDGADSQRLLKLLQGLGLVLGLEGDVIKFS